MPGTRCFIALVVATCALVLPAREAIAQQCQMPRSAPFQPARSSAALSGPLWSSSVWVQEREPNDSVRAANVVTLGDTVRGMMDHAWDHDYFALDLPAGTLLDVDVDAMSLGSKLDTYLTLLSSDGTTVLVESDFDMYTPGGSHDAHLRYRIQSAGRYYIHLEARSAIGAPPPDGADYFYRLRLTAFNRPRGGPGDPGTIVAAGGGSHLVFARKLVAGAAGDFYSVDRDGNNYGRVIRISADGGFSTVLSGLGADPMGGLAVEASGNLLVSACERPNGVIWRITPSGEKTRFYSGEFTPGPLVIGPDGDVWAWMGKDPGSPVTQLWRFDAAGNRKETVPGVAVSGDAAVDLAFSPWGELHVAWDGGIYRYVGDLGVLQRVAAEGGYLAFDKDGYLYVTDTYQGIVSLRNPQYQVMEDTFAIVGDHFQPDYVGGIAFGRANGTTTARLLVTHTHANEGLPGFHIGDLVALNPAGVRAAGWPVGQQGGGGNVTVSVADVANALMGGAALSAAAIEFLDGQGNHNGILDVGDLRAYLRAQGQFAGRRQP